jgi:hypothetical protein
MANEVFERVHRPTESRNGFQETFACWKHKSFIWLFVVSLLPVLSFSWSAQPVVRMAQPSNSLGWLSIYAARASGYFNDEGIALELIKKVQCFWAGEERRALFGGFKK